MQAARPHITMYQKKNVIDILNFIHYLQLRTKLYIILIRGYNSSTVIYYTSIQYSLNYSSSEYKTEK